MKASLSFFALQRKPSRLDRLLTRRGRGARNICHHTKKDTYGRSLSVDCISSFENNTSAGFGDKFARSFFVLGDIAGNEAGTSAWIGAQSYG